MSWNLVYPWNYKFADLAEYLQQLGTSPDVTQWVNSQPDPNFYVGLLKQNPGMSIDELAAIPLRQRKRQIKQKEQPYPPEDMQFVKAKRYQEPFRTWVLIQMRKLRAQDPNLVGHHLRDFDQIQDWVDRNGIEITSYSFSQAMQMQEAWHKTMAGQGEGLMFEPTKPEAVVFSPQEWNGWSVQKVTSENDLLAEGNMMDHCVGDYCEEVQNESVYVYSLRDAENEPHVTIGINKEGGIFQLQGHGNSEPKPEYKAMIKQWFEELKTQIPNLHMDDEDFSFDELSHVENDKIDEKINEIVYRGGEYGLTSDISGVDIEDLYNTVSYELSANRSYLRRHDDVRNVYYIAPVMAQVAWDADKARAQKYELSFDGQYSLDPLKGLTKENIVPMAESDPVIQTALNYRHFLFESNKMGVAWLWDKFEENNKQFYDNFDIYDSGESYLDPDDYETEEEYEVAVENERDENIAEQEREARKESLPWALDDALAEHLLKLARTDPIIDEWPFKTDPVKEASTWKHKFSQDLRDWSFTLVGRDLVWGRGYHQDILTANFGIPPGISRELSFYLPRGAITNDGESQILEASKELAPYATEITEQTGLTPMRMNFNSGHYTVKTNPRQLIAALKAFLPYENDKTSILNFIQDKLPHVYEVLPQHLKQQIESSSSAWNLKFSGYDDEVTPEPDPRRKLPKDPIYDAAGEDRPSLGDRVFEQHGVWQYPFQAVKKDPVEGWYLDWFENPGSIHKIENAQIGDKVGDDKLNMTPYWEISNIDEQSGRIYVNPIEPNPFLSGVGAGGHEFTEHDFDVQSGTYEQERIDRVLDIINKKIYTDPRDIAYMLLGTVPLHVGPNGSQGGWYAPTDRSSRGAAKGMRPQDIMMADAATLKKLGLAVPQAALDGTLPPGDFKYVMDGGLPYVSDDRGSEERKMLQIEGENFEDPNATVNMILNHPQPSIKKRNWEVLREKYYRSDDKTKEQMLPMFKSLITQFASISHPKQDQISKTYDPYEYIKEQMIGMAMQHKWTDVIPLFEGSVDRGNRAEVVRAYSELEMIDDIYRLEEHEDDPQVLKQILYQLYKHKVKGSDIIDRNPEKYRNAITSGEPNSSESYYAKELAGTPVWVIDKGGRPEEISQMIDMMNGALLSVEQYLNHKYASQWSLMFLSRSA